LRMLRFYSAERDDKLATRLQGEAGDLFLEGWTA